MLEKLTPADGAEFVATNQPVVFEFDREVTAQKEVVMRCLECERPILRLPASCAGTKCVVANEQGWEADRTYYITYDSTTFRDAWESYFYQPSMLYASFTTAANLCNMEYIAKDWDSDCSCVNTGTHCQCNCGLTAILKAF